MNGQELKTKAAEYNAYFNALNDCFVGKDLIINVLRFALAQRQHVLIFGPPGTAKTALCDVAFSGVVGARKFMTELSMFMGEDALFGPYDARRMREEGILVHRVEEMLPEAHLARIGEFLDGSMPTLRSLLRALNEREMRRGRQILKLPLMSVYCDTNQDPGDFLKKNPYAWAVLDRILFIADLGYLEDPTSMAETLRRFQSGVVTNIKKQISLELIDELSALVVCPPTLITDQMLFVKLGEAFIEYRQRRRQLIHDNHLRVILPEISDRRFCLATQMLEVEAVLSGRLHALPEDMRSCYLVLGHTPEERQLWEEICETKIQEIQEFKGKQLNHAQMAALESIHLEIERLDMSDLAAAGQTINTLERQLSGITPENDDVEVAKVDAEDKLRVAKDTVRQRVLEQFRVA